MSKIKTDIAKI